MLKPYPEWSPRGTHFTSSSQRALKAIGSGRPALGLLSALAATSAVSPLLAEREVPAGNVQNVVPAKAEDYPWMLGVNLASAGFGGVYPGTVGTHYGWPTAEDIDYHKARGMELIRLPFRWERVQRSYNAELWPSEMARMDEFLDLAEERGVLVILDMHNFGRYHIWDGKGSTPYTNYPGYIIGSPQAPRSAFVDVWRKLATHLKDRDCIWAYDIMNEPYNMGSYDWKTTAQYAINGIRQVDPDTMIMISGDSYSSAVRWVSASGDLIELNDPSDNLIFQAHVYFDRNQSGAYPSSSNSFDLEEATVTRGVEWVTPFQNWLTEEETHGFLGEFGIPDEDPRWGGLIQNLLAYLKDNNMSATYWAAGPRWGNYHLRSNIRANHDESPQMQAMLPYLTEAPKTGYWPSYTWYGESNYPGTAKNLASGISGSSTFTDKSSGAQITANYQSFLSSASFPGRFGGIQLDYTVPQDGFALTGMTINQGVNLTANHERDHILEVIVRSASGGSPSIYLKTLDGEESAKADLGTFADLSDDSWHTAKIPLAAFNNEHFDGTQRVLSIVVENGSTDGAEHRLLIGSIIIKRSDETPPETVVSTSNGRSVFTPGDTVTATATASDGEKEIDFVEFWVGPQRVAIDSEAPYEGEFTLAEAGNYRLRSIAYDIDGNSAQSESITLQVGEFGAFGWLGDLWTGYYEDTGWLYHVAMYTWLYPNGDDPNNLWFWNERVRGWVWSSASLYPHLYFNTAEHQGWYYLAHSTEDGHAWYYNRSKGEWVVI